MIMPLGGSKWKETARERGAEEERERVVRVMDV